MSIIRLKANIKPSTLFEVMNQHRGDVSEGTDGKELARRIMLGRKVKFFHDGRHIVESENITEEEEYNSELLKLAHASLLVGGPVGDKRYVYVDATKNPVEVWLYNQPAEQFINASVAVIQDGTIPEEFIKDETSDHVINGLRRQSTEAIQTIEIQVGGWL